MTETTLDEQADEAELHRMGLASTIRRAEAGEIKRAPHDIERMRQRWKAARDGAETLRRLSDEALSGFGLKPRQNAEDAA